jgi:hypothetical protein
VITALLAGTLAWAQPAAAPTAPAALQTHLSVPPRLSGNARLSFLGFEVYDAFLWVTPGFAQDRFAQHPFALELRYLRDFEGGVIAQRSLREMQRVDSISPEQGERWLADMTRLFPDVKRGDRLTGIHLPSQGLRLLHNDQQIGEIRDPQFARAFMSIWLSPRTSEPQLRRQLLADAR